MHQRLKPFIAVGICVILAALLASCSRVTHDNYSKVAKGMSKGQVVSILGEPTKSSSIKLGNNTAESLDWSSGDNKINIVFINDKVVLKSFNGKSGGDNKTDLSL